MFVRRSVLTIYRFTMYHLGIYHVPFIFWAKCTYILLNNSSVVHSIRLKPNHFLPKSLSEAPI